MTLRMADTLARLDAAELSLTLRLNRSVKRAGVLAVFRCASRLGDGIVWYAHLAILSLLLGTTGRATALRGAIAGLIGLVIYRLLKTVLVRERPFVTHQSIICAGRPLDRFSFPSGHTLHAMCALVIIGSSFPLYLPVLAVLAALIALSRVVLGLHYPSDVVVGAALGIAIGTAANRWLVP
jgi:undecaprenyl-diphosphatase